MDNLWTRRTNANKLSLSTPGSGQNETGSTGRSFSSSSKRFGGESSSHGSRNPFNEIKSPASALASPGAAANAFALGTGAFSNFGAKTPKSGGNPFEQGLKTPSTEKSAKEANGHGNGGPKFAVVSNTKPGATQANKDKRQADQSANHLLRNSWCFWYRPSIPKNIGYIPYEDTVHGIAAVSTAEEFWAVYRHLKRPSALPLVSDYHLFKKGVRPIWEDEENRKGGKWVVRLKKGVADRYWEDLMLALVGDQFGDAGDEVCGAVMSVRNGEDILSIWCARDGGRVLKIRETFKRVLNFPPDTKIEWKVHEESIQQRITVEESRKERANQHKAGNKQNNPRQVQQQQGNDDSTPAPQAS
ncbi:hypothetical protein VPNG_09868 [Cytospora leucostoma]|uniref:Translation initiation factor eIF4E3 n=1 Tax=Cytospora leucostoma TaxID=1230097 RepID=A0A423VNP4_9PEZI|nr:hypothetical protein VPNG_09868 [Cytospora leucostoma]